MSAGCIVIRTTPFANTNGCVCAEGPSRTTIAFQRNVKAIFFQTPSAFRDWLEQHHAKADVVWVGFHRKSSRKPSITWSESVDEALCYGWIDGIRQGIDDLSYRIRFTPRKRGSIWSSLNIRRAQMLIENKRMQPAGLKAYEARKENKTGIYSYEQRSVDLPEPYNSLLKKNQAAWNFFQIQPASYRKAISWWVISAKKEETRLKRVEKLIANSVQGQRLPEFAPRKYVDQKSRPRRTRTTKVT